MLWKLLLLETATYCLKKFDPIYIFSYAKYFQLKNKISRHKLSIILNSELKTLIF